MSSILSVNEIEKKFSNQFLKSKTILNKVSFNVNKGASVGFIGANGSGKTTTIKCLMQFIFPDSGSIQYFGQNNFSDKIKRKIGFVSERPYLPDFMSVEEFLFYHWKLSGESRSGFAKKSDQLLKQVHLFGAKDRPLRAFSKGMQQRAAIAQALLLNPELIILDEPMSGLDPDGRLIVKEIIQSEHQKGTTILFSSHLLSDMDDLCTDIIMMESGNVVFKGDLHQFSSHLGQEYSVTYRTSNQTVESQTVTQNVLEDTIREVFKSGSEIISVHKINHNVEAAYARYRKMRGE